jgi:hypothetical protein
MSLNIGRKGKVFLKKEAAFGTEEVLAATNFLRHLSVNFSFDPFQRVVSAERKTSPGAVNLFDRRQVAGLSSLQALLRPSGVLNTVPEVDPILECAFGTKRNVVLSTTIAAAGLGTTVADTLTSAAGLAVGDALVFTRSGVKYVRFLTTVNTGTGVITWAPALPTPMADGETVKSAITYKLSTDLALSLTVAHYLSGFKRELTGAAIDSLKLDFDGTEEARLDASGPAKEQRTGTAQAEPASATQVGGNPPTGMVGELYIGNTAYLHRKLGVDLKNGLAMRNVEAGSNVASEVYRANRRETMVSLEAFAETEATLYDLCEAGTYASLFRQNGRTEGNIVAVYCPIVNWQVPETTNEEDATNWNFTGRALESTDGANDELILAVA